MYEHRVIDLRSRSNTQCAAQSFSQPPAPPPPASHFIRLPSTAHVTPYPTSQASRWASQGSQDYSAPFALRECQLSLPQATPLPRLASAATRIATPAITTEDPGFERDCQRRHSELCEALRSLAKSMQQTQTSSAELMECVVAEQRRLGQAHQQTSDTLQRAVTNLTQELHRISEAVTMLCGRLMRDRPRRRRSSASAHTCTRRACSSHATRSTRSTRHRVMPTSAAPSLRRSGNVVTLSRSTVRGQPSASLRCGARPTAQKQRVDTTASADAEEGGCTSSTRLKTQCSKQCIPATATLLACGTASMLGALSGTESDECDLFFIQ